MPVIDDKPDGEGQDWKDDSFAMPHRRGFRPLAVRHLSTKLILLLMPALVLTFGLLGFLNISLHRHRNGPPWPMPTASMTSSSAAPTHYMMGNDRESLHRTINTFAEEPGVMRIRVINPEGMISFSTSGETDSGWTSVPSTVTPAIASRNRFPG